MKKISPWLYPVCTGLFALVYFPHVSAFIFSVGCVLSLPIPKMREFLAGKGLSGVLKTILLAVILFAGIMATPSYKEEKSDFDESGSFSHIEPTTRNKGSEEIISESDKTADTVGVKEPPREEEPKEPLNMESEKKEGQTPSIQTEPDSKPESQQPEEPDVKQNPDAPPANQNSGENGDNFNIYDNVDQQKTTSSYVLNTSTMKFHKPSCNSVKKIAPDNYSTYDGAREDVIAKGYDPCGNCHP